MARTRSRSRSRSSKHSPLIPIGIGALALGGLYLATRKPSEAQQRAALLDANARVAGWSRVGQEVAWPACAAPIPASPLPAPQGGIPGGFTTFAPTSAIEQQLAAKNTAVFVASDGIRNDIQFRANAWPDRSTGYIDATNLETGQASNVALGNLA